MPTASVALGGEVVVGSMALQSPAWQLIIPNTEEELPAGNTVCVPHGQTELFLAEGDTVSVCCVPWAGSSSTWLWCGFP